MAAKTQGKHTSMQILDVAQKLVQTRGFNAFSYADIAKVLGVTTASLHYHFASKADLGVKLIELYESAFGAALARIDRDASDAPARVSRYFGLYAQVLADERGVAAVGEDVALEVVREDVELTVVELAAGGGEKSTQPKTDIATLLRVQNDVQKLLPQVRPALVAIQSGGGTAIAI